MNHDFTPHWWARRTKDQEDKAIAYLSAFCQRVILKDLARSHGHGEQLIATPYPQYLAFFKSLVAEVHAYLESLDGQA